MTSSKLVKKHSVYSVEQFYVQFYLLLENKMYSKKLKDSFTINYKKTNPITIFHIPFKWCVYNRIRFKKNERRNSLRRKMVEKEAVFLK